MTTAPGPAPVPPADAGDLAEQARELVADAEPREAEDLPEDAETADALDQQREIGWDEEHDAAD